MKLKINGTERELDQGASIPDVLAILGFGTGRGVAVAVDGEVVPRSRWDGFDFAEGMKVEVLRAVQGG